MERARTVLVVDDHEAHRRLLTMVLQAHLYDVTSAADGFEALAYLRGHTPDAIILDVCMPGMSGFDVALRIRRLRRLQAIPIVIMTSVVDDDTRRLARDCGAAQIVAKPISGTDLRTTLQRLFA